MAGLFFTCDAIMALSSPWWANHSSTAALRNSRMTS